MIQSYLAQGSTYAGDIDFLFDMIFWIVGVWFLISSGVFFWLVFKFRVSGNEGTAQYITGEEKSQKRWITIPHLLVLVCDVFIIWGAVRVWYDIKQHLPEPDREVRVITQQWAWTFVHPGQDGNFDTADDIHTVNELRLEKDAVYHYHLTSNDVMHDFSVRYSVSSRMQFRDESSQAGSRPPCWANSISNVRKSVALVMASCRRDSSWRVPPTMQPG